MSKKRDKAKVGKRDRKEAAKVAAPSARSYVVAKPKAWLAKMHGRLNARTGDEVALTDGRRLTQIGRSLYRNHPAAKRALRHIVQRVIGRQGILPQFVDDDLDAAFKQWARNAGLRPKSWREILTEAVSEFIVSGNGFAYIGERNERFYVSTFEQEQLAGHATGLAGGEGNIVSGGIEFDRFGVPVAYHVDFHRPANSAVGSLFAEPYRLPANRVMHLWRTDQPGQFRGVSDFATGAIHLFDMDDAIFAELNGLKLQGWAGLHRKPDINGTEPGNLSESMGAEELAGDERPATLDPTLNGAVESEVSFGPGEVFDFEGDVRLLDSNRPGGQFLPFMNVLSNYWAVSVGVSPHIINGDYSKANYSSLKASDNANRPTFEETQTVTIERFCDPVVRGFVAWALISGAVQARGRTVESVMSTVTWQKPGFPYVDPLKEIQADEMRLQLGAITWDQWLAERGLDGRQQRQAILAKRALDERLGVQTPDIGFDKITDPNMPAELSTDSNVQEIAT